MHLGSSLGVVVAGCLVCTVGLTGQTGLRPSVRGGLGTAAAVPAEHSGGLAGLHLGAEDFKLSLLGGWDGRVGTLVAPQPVVVHACFLPFLLIFDLLDEPFSFL